MPKGEENRLVQHLSLLIAQKSALLNDRLSGSDGAAETPATNPPDVERHDVS